MAPERAFGVPKIKHAVRPEQAAAAAHEAAEFGVTVNCVCPGPTDTPIWQSYPEEWRNWKANSIPLRRVSTPEEQAWAYVYLASDEASYMTGQSVSPNGGMRLLLFITYPPAATASNVGIYGTGQAYEQLLLRMRAHPLAEVRAYAELMLAELRKVIPAFLRRVDLPDRGEAWAAYLADTRRGTREVAERLLEGEAPAPRDEVTLTDFDPEGEVKVVAAALYASAALPDDQLLARARRMTPAERAAVLEAYVGKRTNRRHKPGRALERTAYRFDVLADYGAFRDLQRHRLLTLEWQALSPRYGHVRPDAVDEAGARSDWDRVLDASAALHDAIAGAGLAEVAPYAVAMAYRVRFYMEMNAREAMHLIELRSAPQGHPAYRRIAQAMHRLIAAGAGHRALAAAMTFADHSDVALERLEAERAAELRRPRRS